MAIKGVLKEELENSIRMQEKYEEELEKLPSDILSKAETVMENGLLGSKRPRGMKPSPQDSGRAGIAQ